MSNHDLGDKYEHICRQILLERWPNSKIIETKRNSIHGIDFAIEIPNQGIMIIEVKPPTGSAHGKQMTLDWIKSNITDNFKNVLQQGYEKGYYLGAATYRVVPITLGEDGENFTLKIASRTRELNWNDILDSNNIGTKQIQQTNQRWSKQQLTIDELILECESLKNNLNSTINSLTTVKLKYAQEINALAGQKSLIKDIVQKLQENQSETNMLIKKIVENIQCNDIFTIKKVIQWLNNNPK